MKPLITVSSEMSEACQTAVDVWGQSEQLTQSMGECGEYIAEVGRHFQIAQRLLAEVSVLGKYTAEVGRHFQGRDPELNKVADEAADVIILMMQVRELVGGDRFDEVLARKFDKFSSKVNNAKAVMQAQAIDDQPADAISLLSHKALIASSLDSPS